MSKLAELKPLIAVQGSLAATALLLNKPRLDNLANEIWKSAERLRGKFKPYEYQSVILPIIVIRRLGGGFLRCHPPLYRTICHRKSGTPSP